VSCIAGKTAFALYGMSNLRFDSWFLAFLQRAQLAGQRVKAHRSSASGHAASSASAI